MINSPVSYLEIIFSAWRVEWGNAVGININNICKERDSWRHHSLSLNLSQCLSCGSAGSWLQRSDQQPIFMRTSQLHLSGMLWKIPILWERKDPVIIPLLLLRKMIVGDQIKTYWWQYPEGTTTWGAIILFTTDIVFHNFLLTEDVWPKANSNVVLCLYSNTNQECQN